MRLMNLIVKAPYTVLFILFATIAIPTLNSDFLFIDDIKLIVENHRLGISPDNLSAVFSRPLGQIFDAEYYPTRFIYYRPALNLLYMFNNLVWGINPVGFHISNLLLHFCTTVIIYHIGIVLFRGGKGFALLAASIFCVHPVHNELIGRVAMNENLLGFLMVLSLYYYLKEQKIASVAVFACALLTKESAVMLPFVLMLFELRKSRVKETIKALLPYAIVMAVYLGVRSAVVGPPGNINIIVNWLETFLTSAQALSVYIRLLLVPYPLSFYYPSWEFTSLYQLDILISIITCMLLVYVIWRTKDDNVISPLIVGVVILLLPVIYKANQLILGLDSVFIAERQLYIPAILFSLCIAALFNKYYGSTLHKILIAAVICSLPFMVYLTYTSSSIWRNSDALISSFVKNYPDSMIAHQEKIGGLIKKGDLDSALIEFKASLRDKSKNDTNVTYKLNSSYSKKLKGYAGLIDKYDLVAYQPIHADLHYAIGQYYRDKNDIDSALKKFKTVIVLQPHSVEAHTELGNIYMKKKLYADASREYKLALKETYKDH